MTCSQTNVDQKCLQKQVVLMLYEHVLVCDLINDNNSAIYKCH